MSHVTSITVMADLETEGTERCLQDLHFVEVSNHCGGSKATQASVWCAAFNYLESELDLWESLHQITWSRPAGVLYFINREEEDGWQPWVPRAKYGED